jgi:hypothetical protein
LRPRAGILVLLAAAVTLATAASALAGGGRPTSVAVYRPFTSAGALKASIKVDETLSGSCFASSLASRRSDAWRCTVANDIYDPCFSDPTGGAAFVVCPEFGSPPRRVDRIDLTDDLPAPDNTAQPGTRRGLPFVLLARPYAGYCDLLTGSAGTIGGRRVRYNCGLGGSLVGTLNRRPARWTTKLITEGDNPTLYTVRVRIAWY